MSTPFLAFYSIIKAKKRKIKVLSKKVAKKSKIHLTNIKFGATMYLRKRKKGERQSMGMDKKQFIVSEIIFLVLYICILLMAYFIGIFERNNNVRAVLMLVSYLNWGLLSARIDYETIERPTVRTIGAFVSGLLLFFGSIEIQIS